MHGGWAPAGEHRQNRAEGQVKHGADGGLGEDEGDAGKGDVGNDGFCECGGDDAL